MSIQLWRFAMNENEGSNRFAATALKVFRPASTWWTKNCCRFERQQLCVAVKNPIIVPREQGAHIPQ
jgi:hypothetical protein